MSTGLHIMMIGLHIETEESPITCNLTSGSFTDPESRATEALLERFNSVFLSHDPAPLQELVADDCVVENTQPAPDGSRHEGKEACVGLWTSIATNPDIHFE